MGRCGWTQIEAQAPSYSRSRRACFPFEVRRAVLVGLDLAAQGKWHAVPSSCATGCSVNAGRWHTRGRECVWMRVGGLLRAGVGTGMYCCDTFRGANLSSSHLRPCCWIRFCVVCLFFLACLLVLILFFFFAPRIPPSFLMCRMASTTRSVQVLLLHSDVLVPRWAGALRVRERGSMQGARGRIGPFKRRFKSPGRRDANGQRELQTYRHCESQKHVAGV